jgi:hypothetical protein
LVLDGEPQLHKYRSAGEQPAEEAQATNPPPSKPAGNNWPSSVFEAAVQEADANRFQEGDGSPDAAKPEEPWTRNDKPSRQREILLIASRSRQDHRDIIERQYYHGPFSYTRGFVQEDLSASVPFKGLSEVKLDLPTRRGIAKHHLKQRAINAKTLRQIYEESHGPL